MTSPIIDTLNRTAKLFLDNGTAENVEAAIEKLRSFTFHLHIDTSAANSATNQAALLTALNCGRRMMLGGVSVSGDLSGPLSVPIVPCATLAEAVQYLGGTVYEAPPEGVPLVMIGNGNVADAASFAIRTTFDGWCAGIVPVADKGLSCLKEFTPAGVLAGSLAVAEVFAFFEGDAMAGYRSSGLSLWNQDNLANWLEDKSDGPAVEYLPSDFWLIGLGHLGQAFLWTIGWLPFAKPEDVRIYLQDIDKAGVSTKSTSILTFESDVGIMKTRTCAAWGEARGFKTNIVERRFDKDMRVLNSEPSLALCGVDNPHTRAILEDAGFSSVFEAGLGNGTCDFRLIRTHSFPAARKANELWAEDGQVVILPDQLPPGYQDLVQTGALDQCGVTRLAEVAVGAPFVGAVAGALLISQLIRFVSDGRRPAVVNLDLRAMQHRSILLHEVSESVIFRTTSAGEPD